MQCTVAGGSTGREQAAKCKETARTHAVKVRDDFVEDAETLDAPVVDALFGVEVGEVWDGGEHHAYFIVGLTVQLLSVKEDSRQVSSWYSK